MNQADTVEKSEAMLTFGNQRKGPKFGKTIEKIAGK